MHPAHHSHPPELVSMHLIYYINGTTTLDGFNSSRWLPDDPFRLQSLRPERRQHYSYHPEQLPIANIIFRMSVAPGDMKTEYMSDSLRNYWQLQSLTRALFYCFMACFYWGFLIKRFIYWLRNGILSPILFIDDYSVAKQWLVTTSCRHAINLFTFIVYVCSLIKIIN